MTERARKTVTDAVFVWEVGMLKFLLQSGVLNEVEYKGILHIAERDWTNKFVS